MSDDSDVDDRGYEKLLKSINLGRDKSTLVRKNVHQIDAKDLLSSVKLQKKSLARAKMKVEENEKKTRKSTALPIPLHRQEKERIQGKVGYIELKKDLAVWKDIIDTNRMSDQLSFPLHQEHVLYTDSAAMKAENFKPKTDFEKELADLVKTSKHNLDNETVYTEAELEILRAMDLQQAKERLRKLQRNRALISFQEAKNRYQKKIKSKGYHRLLKRQKRKALIKEFDELLVRDPDAAREKLKLLETDRVLERGSLKHHARSKFRMNIMRHAGKDPEAKKVLEEHLRIGKELREKISMNDDDSSNDEEEDKVQSVADMIRCAALAAAEDDTPSKLEAFQTDEAEEQLKLFEMRAAKRSKIAKLKADGTVEKIDKLFDENPDWNETPAPTTTAPETDPEPKTPGKRKLKKNKKRSLEAIADETAEASVADETAVSSEKSGEVKNVDEIFEQGNAALINKIRQELEKDEPEKAAPSPAKKKKILKKKVETEEEPDLTLDPKHFLKLETSNLNKVSADFDDGVDDVEDDQSKLIAEAFKDEDVIGEFEKEKDRIENLEKPKDINLTLQGWGEWTGPGWTGRKKREYIVKANEKKRRDRGKNAVIIQEKTDMPIHRLQPRDLPFPFTSVEDYQNSIRPIGRDYNPVSVTRDICKPSVVTQAGRSIRPMDKEEALTKKIVENTDIKLF